MTTALLANLGFELELANRPVPDVVARQSERFSHVLRLVPGCADASPLKPGEAADHVVAWGPSGAAREIAGPAADEWPEPSVAQAANDKRTSHRIERQLGCALPGSTVAKSSEELRDATNTLERGWVAKDPFGVAGRGQVRSASKDALARASRMLADYGALVVEPWVEVTELWSLHFDITDDENVYVGACELLADDQGTFRGNRVPFEAPAAAVDIAYSVCEELAAIGWRGPVGIDGFRGVLNDEEFVRPVCEINARWSFGRLALHLARRLGGRGLAWRHPARSQRRLPTETANKTRIAGVYRLPEDIDPSGKSGTYVELT